MEHLISILQKRREIVHGFSEIKDGNMSFLWGEESVVLENRRKFLRRMNIQEDRCAVMSICDDNKIVSVNETSHVLGISRKTRISSDALITKEKRIFLFLVIADCIPIILFDPVEKVIALMHVGRKSADSGIVGGTLRLLGEKYKTDPRNCIIGMGPSIHKDSYILDKVDQEKERWGIFLDILPDGRVSVDVSGYVTNELMRCGVRADNIEKSAIDTASSQFFFSHYRAKKNNENEGRFCAIIGMV